MISRLLVALDGSPLAEAVLPFAETLAQAGDMTIVLIRVVHPSDDPGVDPNLVVADLGHAEAYAEGIARQLSARGLRVEKVVAVGYPAETIVETVKTRHADLVLLTTHGRSGLSRWIYGSVAESVLAHSTVPVLLMRSSPAKPLAASPGSVPRLLIPLDGSDFAEVALPLGEELVQILSTELHLVRVVPPLQSWTPNEAKEERRGASRMSNGDEYLAAEYLDLVVGQLRAHGVHTTRAVWVDQPADGIAAAAAALGSGLIVMATHGRTGLARALIGSVALEVLHRVTLPVLFVRPVVDARAS